MDTTNEQQVIANGKECTLHRLKIKHEFQELYYNGLKNWELRYNDRDFKAGEYIMFEVIETGAQYIRQITNVFNSTEYGLKDGFVILSIENAE